MPDFIIIDKVNGQFTISFEKYEYYDFLVIKQLAIEESWKYMKKESTPFFPILSTSPDETDETKYIEEHMPLDVYKLQNGGIIYVHYLDLNSICTEFNKN